MAFYHPFATAQGQSLTPTLVRAGPWCSVFGKDIHLTPDSEVVDGYGTGWGGNPYFYAEDNDGSLLANDGSSLVANSGDQILKGNSGPWMAGDQILTIDTTKENLEYICVEMADDHPAAKMRADIATKDATIATKIADIATKDAAIATKDATIATKIADIATKDAAIATKDATIATKIADIATKDAAIATKDTEIADKNIEIAAAPKAKDDGIEDGAAAGIGVGCFLGGLLVGAIIISMILCPAARQQNAAVTKSTTPGVKVEQLNQVGI